LQNIRFFRTFVRVLKEMTGIPIKKHCLLIIIGFMMIRPFGLCQTAVTAISAAGRVGAAFTVDPSATPDTICPGTSSQLRANPSGGTPPITYLWSPANGLDDPTSPDPVASPASTTVYTVTATDASLQTASDSVELFMKLPPETPGPISGPDAVCKDSVSIHTIAEVYGSTSYSWTVPQGDSILSGQNTVQVRIRWSGLPGTLSVIAGNDCGNSNPSVLMVSVETPPQITEKIEGPENPCIHENITFSIGEVAGATTYLWSVPEDAEITGGQGTRILGVTWGSEPGTVSVQAGNFCGYGEPVLKEIQADSTPGPPGPVDGKGTVCLNHDGYLYSVDTIPGAETYEWTLPEGAEITDGKGTARITVFFNIEAKSGMLHVYAENHCGKGVSSALEIIVKSCTSIPGTSEEIGLQIFPNPSKDRVFLIPPANETIRNLRVYDPAGRLLLSADPGGEPGEKALLQTAGAFRPGIYFIHVQCGEKNYIRKMIIER
jgi:hypothetical protein